MRRRSRRVIGLEFPWICLLCLFVLGEKKAVVTDSSPPQTGTSTEHSAAPPVSDTTLLSAQRLQALQGKVAIVTGSSSGIGRALAYETARWRMRVVLADIDIEATRRVVAEIRARGGEAIAVQADLSEDRDRARLIRTAMRTFGRIDLLLNNAGYGYMVSQEDLALDQARREFDVNFWAYVDLARRVIPFMKRVHGGYIINMASVLGLQAGYPAVPCTGMYAASKQAIVAWSTAIAEELAPQGIVVKVVCPAWVNTAFFHHMRGPAARRIEAEVLSGSEDFDEPETIARATLEQLMRTPTVILPGQAPAVLAHRISEHTEPNDISTSLQDRGQCPYECAMSTTNTFFSWPLSKRFATAVLQDWVGWPRGCLCSARARARPGQPER